MQCKYIKKVKQNPFAKNTSHALLPWFPPPSKSQFKASHSSFAVRKPEFGSPRLDGTPNRCRFFLGTECPCAARHCYTDYADVVHINEVIAVIKGHFTTAYSYGGVYILFCWGWNRQDETCLCFLFHGGDRRRGPGPAPREPPVLSIC